MEDSSIFQLDLLILTHFKILPTDERYRNLNMLQKSVLASSIEREYQNQFNRDKYLLDALKVYINPDMYKAEKDYEKGGAPERMHENREFAQHYRSALAGKVELSDDMKKAIEWLQRKKAKEKPPAPAPAPRKVHAHVDPSEDDEEVLGR